MYHMSYEHTSKAPTVKNNGKTKKAVSCVKRFRYITRTKEYANHKDHAEKVEYVSSGNMPSFCKDRPDQFWEAAELYERKNGRTATSICLLYRKNSRLNNASNSLRKSLSSFVISLTFRTRQRFIIIKAQLVDKTSRICI